MAEMMAGAGTVKAGQMVFGLECKTNQMQILPTGCCFLKLTFSDLPRTDMGS